MVQWVKLLLGMSTSHIKVLVQVPAALLLINFSFNMAGKGRG